MSEASASFLRLNTMGLVRGLTLPMSAKGPSERERREGRVERGASRGARREGRVEKGASRRARREGRVEDCASRRTLNYRAFRS